MHKRDGYTFQLMPIRGLSRKSGRGRSTVLLTTERPAWEVEMDVQRLLDLGELAEVLGRSPETIKKDLKRNPLAVPPRLQLPGTRLLRWRAVDVDSWLEQHVQTAGGRHV